MASSSAGNAMRNSAISFPEARFGGVRWHGKKQPTAPQIERFLWNARARGFVEHAGPQGVPDKTAPLAAENKPGMFEHREVMRHVDGRDVQHLDDFRDIVWTIGQEANDFQP